MTGSDFDWMVSNHAVYGWKAPVKASVSGVSLLQLSPFFASIFPFSPETPDTQATNSNKLTPNTSNERRLGASSEVTNPGILLASSSRDFKMAAANSTTSLTCEVCTATVTLYSKFCATCGAELDIETQALKYYFNEGYEYEVILCFLLKYH